MAWKAQRVHWHSGPTEDMRVAQFLILLIGFGTAQIPKSMPRLRPKPGGTNATRQAALNAARAKAVGQKYTKVTKYIKKPIIEPKLKAQLYDISSLKVI